MSKNPYQDMRKRNVAPLQKGEFFLRAAAEAGKVELSEDRDFFTSDPERVRRVLKRVVGEENMKHVHIKSSNKQWPEFEIDGVRLEYRQGSEEAYDYFKVEYADFEDECQFAHSLAELGSSLMFFMDVMADDDPQAYGELLEQMKLRYIGIDATNTQPESEEE